MGSGIRGELLLGWTLPAGWSRMGRLGWEKLFNPGFQPETPLMRFELLEEKRPHHI
jgi:hypothetical protein